MGDELDVGTDISRDIALSLLNGGLAVPVKRTAVETADEPVHVGGGWYRVKGAKVKGKEAAYAALEG